MSGGPMSASVRRVAFVAALALVIVFYFWTAMTSGQPIAPARSLPCYYAQLGRAFAVGQTHLEARPDPRLLRLADPYDPAQNEPYRLHDAVLFDGKYYLYYGPGPALLLFAPFRMLSGLDLPQSPVVALFCSIGLVFAFLLVKRLAPPDTPFALLLAAIPALAFGSATPFLLRRPLHYEVAIAAGYGFTFASLYFFAREALLERVRRRGLVAASLLLGCAAASRFPMLAAGLIAAVVAAQLVRRTPQSGERLRTLAACFVPLAVCALLLGLYNELRFGSWTEFGVRYILQGEQSARTCVFFSWERLPFGFFYYVLAPPHVTSRFPFFHVAPALVLEPPGDYHLEKVAGLLPSVPFLAILLLAPLLRHRLRRPSLPIAAACLATGLVLLVLYCVAAGTMRYEVDFATFFVVPALLLWFELVMRSAGIRRRLAASVFALLVLVTVVLGCAYSLVGYEDLLRRSHPSTYKSIRSVFRPLEIWLREPEARR